MQSLGGVKNSVLPGQLHRCGPQAPRNRQASAVPAPPPFETPANLLYVVWNIGRPGHRRSSCIPHERKTDHSNYGEPKSRRLTENSPRSAEKRNRSAKTAESKSN